MPKNQFDLPPCVLAGASRENAMRVGSAYMGVDEKWSSMSLVANRATASVARLEPAMQMTFNLEKYRWKRSLNSGIHGQERDLSRRTVRSVRQFLRMS